MSNENVCVAIERPDIGEIRMQIAKLRIDLSSSRSSAQCRRRKKIFYFWTLFSHSKRLCSNTRYIHILGCRWTLSLAKVVAEWIHFRWMGWRQEQKRQQGKEPRQEKKVKLILITLFLANSFLFLAKCLSFQSLIFSPSSSSFLCRSSSSVVVPFGFLCVVGNKKVTKRSRRPICGRLDFSGGLRSAEFIAVQRKTFTTTTKKKADPDERNLNFEMKLLFLLLMLLSSNGRLIKNWISTCESREVDDSLSSAENRPYWDDWGTSVQRKRGNIGDTQKKNEAKHIFYSFIFANKTCCLLLNSFFLYFRCDLLYWTTPPSNALPIQLQQAAAAYE